MPNVRVQRKTGKGRNKSPAGTNPGVMTFGQVAKLALPVFGTELIDAGRGQQYPKATVAVATAFAESGLDSGIYNGICCDGLMQVNRIHRRSAWAVKYFGRVLSEAEFAKAMRRPELNMYAAGIIYNEAGKFGVDGGGGNPWEAFGNGDYHAALPKAHNAVSAIIKGLDPDKLGVVDDITNIPGAIGLGLDVVGEATSFIGRQSAKWFLGATGWVFKLLYREVIHPQWEHAQRATVYYYNEMTGKRDANYMQFATTVLLWSVGYAILWRDSDDFRRKPELDHTPLGRMISDVQVRNATRKLHKPSDAKKQTPTKPKPKVSTAPIAEVRKAKVERKRTVKVDWDSKEGLKVGSETEEKERTPVNG